mgnify:CR=1 FL=1
MKISLNTDSKIILKNFSYLTVLKFFNIGIKVLLAGYLIRILGDVNYGLITWLDSVIQYFLMIINFGFNIYAAKYIVEYRQEKSKINEIVSAIFYIKGLLFVFSILCILFLGGLNEFSTYKELLFLFMFCGVGEVLFPIWFFQGVENLKPATLIVFLSRLFLLIGTILFVEIQESIYTYILLFVLSSIIMGIIGFGYIFKYYKLKIIKVSFKNLKYYFKESIPFFLGRFLSLIFNFGTIFFIGKFCLLEQVTGFDASLKIVMLGVIPFEMLQQAVFPTISRTKNKKLLKKIVITSVIMGGIIGLFTFLLSEELLYIFGGKTISSFSSTLKVLSILSPFVALTFVLGTCSLVAFGYYKEYNFSLIFTSIIYILILIILLFLNEITFWNLIYLRVLGDVVMMLIRLYFSVKKRVLI